MANDNTKALTERQAIAAEALAALDTCHQISPFSARLSAFDLDDAYRVTAAIRQMREMRGEMPVGRKIGFTNRTVWAEYGPIWGYVYNRTVLVSVNATCATALPCRNTFRSKISGRLGRKHCPKRVHTLLSRGSTE